MTLCLQGFIFCDCLECKLIKMYKQTENKLSEYSNKYNMLSEEKEKQTQVIIKRYNLKFTCLSFNEDRKMLGYDFMFKYLENNLTDLDKKIKRLIYRLNSLKNKADLYDIELFEANLIC